MSHTPNPGDRVVTRTFLEKLMAGVMKGIGAAVNERVGKLEERITELEKRPRGIAYRGVWDASKEYSPGDAATSSGSLWIAKIHNRDHRPGADLGVAWTLAVKRGADGGKGR